MLKPWHTVSDFARYLNLMGVSQRKPGREALGEIVRAHLQKIPFENISKLYYRKTSGRIDPPDLGEFLDGIEHFGFGGTCYANNYHLHELLKFLGYEVKLCGAAMSRPDVHVVNVVNVGGREFLVDVGYAAPFLAPFSLDIDTEHSLTFGDRRYVLHPRDGTGNSRLEVYRNGEIIHGYVVKPAPRSIDEFGKVIAGSYDENATFMNAILLTRYSADNSCIIHNMDVVETKGLSVTEHHLQSVEELVRAIQGFFGIPEKVSRVALDGLLFGESAWG